MELSEYKQLSDEVLAPMAAEGDRFAVAELISRFVSAVRKRAESFSNAVPDDLAQEGLVGLLKAIQTFDPDENTSFYTYAMTCVKNRMISAYKKQNFSFEELPNEEEGQCTGEDPESIVLEKEGLSELFNTINSALSDMEWRVFQMYLSGMTYNQIALKLGVSAKNVDNAMQRVRRKLKAVLR